MKLKIAVDVEGTLADIHKVFVDYVNIRFESKLKQLNCYPFISEDITRWDWGDKARSLGLSATDCVNLSGELWQTQSHLVPLTEDKLVRNLTELSKKYELHIVTARKIGAEQIKDWLADHRIPYKKFVYEMQKELLDYPIYIDDDPTLSERVSNSHQVQLLYDRPWNANVGYKPNVFRVCDFGEAESLLAYLTKQRVWALRNFPKNC